MDASGRLVPWELEDDITCVQYKRKQEEEEGSKRKRKRECAAMKRHLKKVKDNKEPASCNKDVAWNAA